MNEDTKGKNRGDLGWLCHSRSFNRAHTTFYSATIEIMYLSCTVVEIQRAIRGKSHFFLYPMSAWRRRLGLA